MAIIQLDFWKTAEESELEALRKEVEAIRKSSDKVRKGIYAKHGELNKICIDLQNRLEVIERNICKG